MKELFQIHDTAELFLFLPCANISCHWINIKSIMPRSSNPNKNEKNFYKPDTFRNIELRHRHKLFKLKVRCVKKVRNGCIESDVEAENEPEGFVGALTLILLFV
jgi:hypothetical protein